MASRPPARNRALVSMRRPSRTLCVACAVILCCSRLVVPELSRAWLNPRALRHLTGTARSPRCSRTVRPATVDEEQALPKAGISWQGAQTACVVLAFLPVQYPTESLDIDMDAPIEELGPSFLVGLCIVLCGIALCIVSLLLVFSAMADSSGRLVTTGPFAVVRHPTYLGFIVMSVGAAIALQSPLRLLFTALLAIVLSKKLDEEEETLKNAKPAQWQVYCEEVQVKLLPFLY
eukprot:TRINITY_DN110649_c0_g1_i1.p1 TRINITY_DN110649_c0_g1~~TRINITY_DN110649_c0_g1_i1.p1  ORF type:complete len:233 (+),score=13.40 TRINITY_DN110649_c0_g1_i1:100-798(+)